MRNIDDNDEEKKSKEKRKERKKLGCASVKLLVWFEFSKAISDFIRIRSRCSQEATCRDIPDIDKCHLGKCCLDNWHCDSQNLF